MPLVNPNYSMNYMGVGTGDPMSMGLLNNGGGYNPVIQAGGAGGLVSGSNPLLGAIGSIGGLWGGLSQANAQNNSASLAQQYAGATSQLNPFSAFAPGGFGGTMQGGNLSLNYGGFNPAFGGLAGFAGNNIDTAGGINSPFGLNPALQGAFSSATSALGGFNPAGAGLAGNATLSASGALANQAAGGFGANELAQYNALQSLQKLGNTNSANILQNTLFGKGQLDSSSGSLAAQGFGQGLAQQNAADAAQAAGLGIQALGTSGYTAGILGNTGGGLLNNAFGNFANQSMLAPSVGNAYLNPALAAIGGAGQLTQQGLGLYNAGLQTSLGQNQASARAGSLATTNANSLNQQSPFGQYLGSMFGSLGSATGGMGGILNNIQQAGGLSNYLSSIFGGGASGVSGADWATALQGLDQSTGSQLASDFGSILSDTGFSSAGGGAAGGGVATGAGAGAANMLMPSTLAGTGASLGVSAADWGSAMQGLDASTAAQLSSDAAAINGGTDAALATSNAGAAGSAAAGTGLEVGAGVAGAGLAGMLAIAAHQNPTALNQNYWNGINSTLAAGPGTGQPVWGANNALAPIAQNTQYQGALSDVFNAYAGQGAGNSTIPDSEWQTLSKYGITPQNIGSLGMPDMGQAFWNSLSQSTGIPEYSTTSRQKL